MFLLADGGPPSAFVMELIEGDYDVAAFGRLPDKDVPCPTCAKGHLVQRENKQSRAAFYGCSNWPYCEHRQPPCPACGSGLPVKAEGGFQCRDCGQRIEACPALWRLAADPDGQVRPLPRLLELPEVRIHPGRSALANGVAGDPLAARLGGEPEGHVHVRLGWVGIDSGAARTSESGRKRRNPGLLFIPGSCSYADLPGRCHSRCRPSWKEAFRCQPECTSMRQRRAPSFLIALDQLDGIGSTEEIFKHRFRGGWSLRLQQLTGDIR